MQLPGVLGPITDECDELLVGCVMPVDDARLSAHCLGHHPGCLFDDVLKACLPYGEKALQTAEQGAAVGGLGLDGLDLGRREIPVAEGAEHGGDRDLK